MGFRILAGGLSMRPLNSTTYLKGSLGSISIALASVRGGMTWSYRGPVGRFTFQEPAAIVQTKKVLHLPPTSNLVHHVQFPALKYNAVAFHIHCATR